jgi:HEAT repeat protein
MLLTATAWWGLLGAAPPATDDTLSADEALLKAEKVGTETADLVAFLRNRIPTDSQRRLIEELIAGLSKDTFADRERATQRLCTLGPAAIPYLQKALADRDPEVRTRAEKCLAEVSRGPGLELTAAVVRVLVRRQAPEALPLLLEFSRDAPDEVVEEEVLNGLAALGIREGKVDPLLREGAKHADAGRRAAVAWVLARSGGVEERGNVRQFLADKDPRVRHYITQALLGGARMNDETPLAEDEVLLQKAKLPSDAAALVEFFRKRTLHEGDGTRIQAWIKQLGGDRFKEREEASRRLVEVGKAALGQIRLAAKSSDQEVARRAEICLEMITVYPGPGLPAAALRLLARRPSADAVEALLDYLPFADDARVEEEVFATLCVLSLREPRVDPVLIRALENVQPVKRAAAALVLGRVGDKDQCAQVRALFKDADPRVRLRAAQGLLSVKDRPAIELLVGLIGENVPADVGQQAEALLSQLAQDKAPTVSLTDSSPELRRKCHEAWTAWWRDHGSKDNLPNPLTGNRLLGLTMVAELIGANANGNRIYELAQDGKVRWELNNLQGPIDAQMLPGGRVLVAEHNAQRVTERNLKGDVLKTFKVSSNPVACQRLTNGNTFIATYNTVAEFDPEEKLLYQHNASSGVGGVIYDGCKLPNGNILCIAGRGTLLELKSNGEKVTTLQLGANGGWCGVAPLPNGRFLVAMLNPGKVVEVDRAGTVHWSAVVPDACHAVRLPNGNTLVACMNKQKVVEINRGGQTVWEQTTTGRPFHVHRR